jgi:tRNA (5-methylaminomethyl-2-thiouridylate)-methyltransferase
MKVAVLVSGGVDSSVALALLRAQGHEVTAFYLKIWLEDELSFLGECPWQDDLRYVEQVCAQFNVPLQVISLQKEYWQEVVSYTIAQVRQGNTPNPDMLCNQRIKFGMFFKHLPPEFDKVATGHYAQVKEHNGLYELHSSPDKIKDQTYFLSYLRQDQLARALFPIGHLTKEEVRALARDFNLPNQARKDSQGICFLGKFKYNDFIKHHVGEQPGDIIEYETGKVVGTHKGFWFHTIGQRQGSGLAGGPWYVVAKDITLNRVYMSRSYHQLENHRTAFIATDCNWIGEAPALPASYEVKLRHGPQRTQSFLTPSDDQKILVQLATKDQGIAAGQFAVWYKGTRCLGAGVISDISS